MSEIRTLPVLPLRDIVVFPHMVVPLFVGRERSISALERAMSQDPQKEVLLSAQRKAKTNDPVPEDIFNIGTVATIIQMLRLPDGTVKVLVEGGTRARIRDVVDVRTHYFLIYGLVRHERARRLKVSLVFRADVLGSGNTTRIIWVRDADAMPEQR